MKVAIILLALLCLGCKKKDPTFCWKCAWSSENETVAMPDPNYPSNPYGVSHGYYAKGEDNFCDKTQKEMDEYSKTHTTYVRGVVINDTTWESRKFTTDCTIQK